MTEENTLWSHLPLLVRSNSKESVEYILQALWRTRSTGLHSSDRDVISQMLQLSNDSDLDPVTFRSFRFSFSAVPYSLLAVPRQRIQRCVYENVNKDEIQSLFPSEVPPEIQRLLTLLLQKFQSVWRQEVLKDQATVPRLKAMTWNVSDQNAEATEPVVVLNLKLQSDAPPHLGESEVKFQLARDTLDTMLRSMYCIQDQLPDMEDT